MVHFLFFPNTLLVSDKSPLLHFPCSRTDLLLEIGPCFYVTTPSQFPLDLFPVPCAVFKTSLSFLPTPCLFPPSALRYPGYACLIADIQTVRPLSQLAIHSSRIRPRPSCLSFLTRTAFRPPLICSPTLASPCHCVTTFPTSWRGGKWFFFPTVSPFFLACGGKPPCAPRRGLSIIFHSEGFPAHPLLSCIRACFSPLAIPASPFTQPPFSQPSRQNRQFGNGPSMTHIDSLMVWAALEFGLFCAPHLSNDYDNEYVIFSLSILISVFFFFES